MPVIQRVLVGVATHESRVSHYNMLAKKQNVSLGRSRSSLHELTELPEYIGAEAEWLLIDSSDEEEPILCLIIYTLHEFLFVHAHHLANLPSYFRVYYAV